MDDFDEFNCFIFIDFKDFYLIWCNIVGIKEFGVENWVDVLGGVIKRNFNGKFIGVFVEVVNIIYVWFYFVSVVFMEECIVVICFVVIVYYEVGYIGMIDMVMDEGVWEVI